MCNVSKMLNLSAFIVKQALNTIGGGANSKRVLMLNGSQKGRDAGGSVSTTDNISGASIELLFGTIRGGVNGVIVRTCNSVARLAMTMGVPIVMLNWP
ncbi:hypothetical protein Pcinc_002067 [Petrolisthes cinctipes]|uniref:Uncharacterized protein n=1 Tax=Petrolisthes cinctipes TaxID=88211 RepID=A0AAE1L2K7_PETCI|nr:hypothetical protein Pcinc_008558 [Petrolisthes cinctipes]KAK3894159.1 hypothetical protein Pcinc_002067 [Petrolisthes cinctipes]